MVLPGQLFKALVAAHKGGSVHDRIDQRLVARAPADIVVFLEPVAHFFTAGALVFLQQGIGGKDEAGRAEAALRRTMENPRVLQGMQAVCGPDAFQRGESRVVVYAAHLDNAGAGRLAIDKHGAGAALALAAADLDTGDVQLVAQHIHQCVVQIDQDTLGHAVDDQGSCFHNSLLGKGNVYANAELRGVARFSTCKTDKRGSGTPGTGNRSRRGRGQ